MCFCGTSNKDKLTIIVFVCDSQEDGEEVVKKIPKKKPPRVEDTRSKKEHVNVVFIGHVGECSTVDSNLSLYNQIIT